MPTVSDFYGIVIRMFYDEHHHNIPHFHAQYAEHKVVINARTLEVIIGEIPSNKLKLVEAWAIIHRAEIDENVRRIDRGEKPHKIKGLK